MIILQVNKMYPPDIGGIETVVKQYAECLVSLDNHSVTVLCCSKKLCLKTKIVTINKVKVVRCSSLGTFFSMPLSFSIFFWFLKLAKQSDIIHFHEPFPIGSILGNLPFFSSKIIVTWHSDIVKQKYIKKMIEIFQKRLLKKSDVITTTSENLQKYSTLLSTFKMKTQIIPISVDFTQLNTPIDMMPTAIDPRIYGKYALFIGRLSYYKGIDFLLESLEGISKMNIPEKITIVIAGEGDKQLRDKLLNFTSNHSVELIFIDRAVSENEKKALLQHAYLFLFPSLYSSEAFGITQLEAMACGVPVINTSLKTGVPWVSLHKVTGLTIKPFDQYALSTAIMHLFKDAQTHQVYSQNCIDRVKSLFSDKVVLSLIRELYLKLS